MYLRVEKAHSFTLCCAYNHFFAPLVRPPYTPVSAECGHVITVIQKHCTDEEQIREQWQWIRERLISGRRLQWLCPPHFVSQ